MLVVRSENDDAVVGGSRDALHVAPRYGVCLPMSRLDWTDAMRQRLGEKGEREPSKWEGTSTGKGGGEAHGERRVVDGGGRWWTVVDGVVVD